MAAYSAAFTTILEKMVSGICNQTPTKTQVDDAKRPSFNRIDGYFKGR
jgi:hypothetical protein